MGDQTHRIERQIFEVVVADQGDAKGLQVTLSRIQRQKIEAIIERACDRIAGPGTLLRIDRLSIDLGEINGEHFEAEFVEALGRQLRSSLESVRVDEARACQTSDEQVARQEIEFFARTGTLPWNSGQRDAKLLHRRMQLLLSRPGRSLAALLRELEDVPAALERLAAHFDDKTLGALVDTLLSPSRLRSIASTGDAVTAQVELSELLRGPGGLADESPRRRHTHAWFGLLRAAARRRPGSALLTQRLFDSALDVLSQSTGQTLPGAKQRLRELTPRSTTELERASAGDKRSNDLTTKRSTEPAVEPTEPPTEPPTERTPESTARPTKLSTKRPTERGVEPSEPPTKPSTTSESSDPSDPSESTESTDTSRPPNSPAADSRETPQNASEQIASKRAPPRPNEAEFVDLIAIWSQIASELGETIGSQNSSHSGPPNARALAQLKQLVDVLVSLGETMQRTAETSIAALFLAQHRRTPLPREGVDFSLMAVANAGKRIAKDSAKDLSRDLGELRKHIEPRTPAGQTIQSNPRVKTASPPAPRRRAQRAPRRAQDITQLHIDDAGLVILWPFLRPLFTHLGLLEGVGFRDPGTQLRAAALLRLVAGGDLEIAEFQLPLAKILCGLDPDALFELDAPLCEEESSECTRMLEAVILRAPILKKMSVAGLRGTFLLRPGILSVRDGSWLLRVEHRPFDLVLERFPWTFEWIKLPWMQTPLQVEWSA